MKTLTVYLSIAVLCALLAGASATRCVPLSSFKVDCNTCFCDAGGDKYFCSRKLCHQLDGFEPINDEAIADNSLFEPVKDDKPLTYDLFNDDLMLPDDFNDNDNGLDERFVQDVGLEDQETEDIGDMALDFRFKRNS